MATSVLKRMGRKVKYDREALEQTIELIQSTPTSETACGVSLSPWRDTDSGLGGVSIRTTLMVLCIPFLLQLFLYLYLNMCLMFCKI